MAIEIHPAGDVRRLCGGAVVLPGDDAYDAARAAWNLTADQRPALIAYPADAREVAEVLAHAAARGLRVAPQATGHNAVPLGSLEDAVLLRTSAMTEIRIDAARRVARAGAGVLWDDVVTAAAPYGLTALHGSSPGVSVVGYSLGGGIGWLARLHGLQCNALTAIEVVLPTGELVRATAATEPELFWGLRGGGGTLGVVTAVEFELFPLTTVYGGRLVWDLARAAEVVPAWVRWARTAPDAATTALRLLRPSQPGGRASVVIDGAIVAEEPEAWALLAPLRALRPDLDTWGVMPTPALPRLHGAPELPEARTSDSCLLDDLDEAGVRALVAAAALVSGLELRQLGGALARPAPGAGVLSHLDGGFALVATGAQATRAVAAMAPWSRGRRYLNLCEQPVDTAAAFTPHAFARLAGLQASVDPLGLLAPNHPVRR
jgi:hypothetical protein